MPAVPTERASGEAVVRRPGRGRRSRRGTRSLKEGKEEAYCRTGGEPMGQDPSRLEWKEGKSVGRWAARLYQVLEVRLRFCCCLFICRFVLTAPCRKGSLLNGFFVCLFAFRERERNRERKREHAREQSPCPSWSPARGSISQP